MMMRRKVEFSINNNDLQQQLTVERAAELGRDRVERLELALLHKLELKDEETKVLKTRVEVRRGVTALHHVDLCMRCAANAAV